MGDTKVKINLQDGTIEIEGSQDFVESHWEELKSFIGKPAVSTKPTTGQKPKIISDLPKGNQKKLKNQPSVTPIALDIKKTEKKPSFKELYAEKKPVTDMEIFTLIAFYLKKYLGINDIEFGHVSFCYTVIGRKRPKDYRSTFKNIQNLKAWVQSGAKPYSFTITQAGEDYITLELPLKKV